MGVATHNPAAVADRRRAESHLGPSSPTVTTDYSRHSCKENFHVLSWLLPPPLREDFANVYAFCRYADDLADIAGTPTDALRRLDDCEAELRACFCGQPRHPIFIALRTTVDRRGLAIDPFLDLLSAFRQDQHMTRYERWPDLLDYCTHSANPVGRVVLTMTTPGASPAALRWSDATCTALQLANFWQDVRRDILDLGRIYVPADVARAHGLSLEELRERVTGNATQPRGSDAAFVEAYRATLADLCARTRQLFADGRQLLPLVGRDVRPTIALFSLGGESILSRIAAIGYRTDLWRPRIGKLRKASLLLKALFAHRWGSA